MTGLPPSAVIKHKPLSSSARRAGWVGCNFNLSRIPAGAQIGVVISCSSGRESAVSSLGEISKSQSLLTSAPTRIISPEEVREKFKRVKPLKEIGVKQHVWTLDVLNVMWRICEVGTAGPAVRAPSGRNLPAALPPVTPRRGVPTNTFTTSDAYAFSRELEKLHPDNRHVRDITRRVNFLSREQSVKDYEYKIEASSADFKL